MPARATVSVEWIPLPSVVAQIYFAAAERASQLKEPLAESTVIISNEIALNFQAQGRPEHWQELKEETVQRRGSSEPILFVSGNLYNQATSPEAWSIGGGGRTWDAELVDTSGYGTFHVEGTVYMPIRDWTFVPDEAIDQVEQVFWDWMEA